MGSPTDTEAVGVGSPTRQSPQNDPASNSSAAPLCLDYDSNCLQPAPQYDEFEMKESPISSRTRSKVSSQCKQETNWRPGTDESSSCNL